ncbi:MAG: hypothetical protein O3B95_12240 [Chloroflexi bacterium]|nr:hypothetical protein [Chloroflexota bacterium]
MTPDIREDSLLVAVLDGIIPPTGNLPGAGGLGLVSELQRMSRDHTKYEDVVPRAITVISRSLDSGEPDSREVEQAIREFEAADPKDFARFLEIVYLAYYSDPRVYDRIGWRTGPLQPEGHPMPPWDESILETTKKREPFWTRVE